MPEQPTSVGMERKLAAIFSTDVAGYSRLMGDDEEATIRTLTASPVKVIRTMISGQEMGISEKSALSCHIECLFRCVEVALTGSFLSFSR